MKKIIIVFVLLFPFVVSAQCKYEAFPGTKTYPPVADAGKIVLYETKKDVPEKAETIGYIICNSDKESRIIPKSRELVAEHGGTGMYYEVINDKDSEGKGIQRLIPKTKLMVVRVQ